MKPGIGCRCGQLALWFAVSSGLAQPSTTEALEAMKAPVPPDYLRGGSDAMPPRSGEVIRLLVGTEAAASDPVGDQSGWIWHLPEYALQNPIASGKQVTVNVSHTVLGRTAGLMFQAVSFGDDTAGNLDNAPNTNFVIWRESSGKTLNDARDEAIPKWADIRRVTIGPATLPHGVGQVPFQFELQGQHPTDGRAVYNFTFADGVPAANLTLVRTGSSWWHYLYLGSKGAYGSGPINDLVKAALRSDDDGKLTLLLDVAANIPKPLSAISGRPTYALSFIGTDRHVKILWLTTPQRHWAAVLRELRGGVWVDIKSLPINVQGSRFTVAFNRADLGNPSPLSWFVSSAGETGIGNDIYFCPFDTLPNDGVVQQP